MNTKQIESYAQLAKQILSINMLDVTTINSLLEGLAFAEDITLTYNNQDMGVSYKQFPIVAGGDVLVKIVMLRQADNFILVLPQKITETYDLLTEEPELIDDRNMDLALYAEIYGFNTNDLELQELIKKAYLDSGDSLPAYELTSELEKKAEEAKEEEATEDEAPDFENDLGGFDDIGSQLDNLALDEEPDLSVNMEAYKAFKKDTDALPRLIKQLAKQPNIVKESIKLKYLSNVLLIKLDNKTIYESLGAHPTIAKKVISNAGELIRTNSETQLLDTFSIAGSRYFVVAEAINNYWYTESDTLSKIKQKDKVIKPLSENIIKLNKTNVRLENRRYRVAELNNELVFI